jgi:hypothetical protein
MPLRELIKDLKITVFLGTKCRSTYPNRRKNRSNKDDESDINLLSYNLHTDSRSWALLEKPPIVQPFENFPAFYGTRRFITAFKRALHCSISWAISIQSTPSHPISVRSLLSFLLYRTVLLDFVSYCKFPSYGTMLGLYNIMLYNHFLSLLLLYLYNYHRESSYKQFLIRRYEVFLRQQTHSEESDTPSVKTSHINSLHGCAG